MRRSLTHSWRPNACGRCSTKCSTCCRKTCAPLSSCSSSRDFQCQKLRNCAAFRRVRRHRGSPRTRGVSSRSCAPQGGTSALWRGTMTELMPLLSSSTDDFERALLGSTESDDLGGAALLRTASLFGIGASAVLPTIVVAHAGAGGASVALWPIVLKWLGL